MECQQFQTSSIKSGNSDVPLWARLTFRDTS